ncbi:MAG: phosphoenolpyruvate synthase [Candidatus Jorgensenbacteria bacterium]|nr:phosphoenolpyruvate synthase [Candidatus Jorgensenbacteria bacterium]
MHEKFIFTVRLEDVGIKDVPRVGGKNASLGEMIQALKPKGVNVPGGFAVTAEAYNFFLEKTGLKKRIKEILEGLNTKNLRDLEKRGEEIRTMIKKTPLPQVLELAISEEYKKMEKEYGRNVDVAVRSSATAEDLPDASFAGQHETFLNMRGTAGVLNAVRASMASLFTNRAISYRKDKGFDHFKIALSVGVQKMVRADKGVSGVMFTLDTESGFRDVVLINGIWGLGELIVQGEVTPDEFFVFKKTLGKVKDPIISRALGKKNRKMIYSAGAGLRQTKVVPVSESEQAKFVISDKEVAKLAVWGMLVEEHYSKVHSKWTPMDLEWAKDGVTGELFLVQARPETVQAGRDFSKVTEYIKKGKGIEIVKGASVGNKIATGKARVILDPKNINDFKHGEVLVTDMTDPDWEPIMKISSAIVTDKGGRTSHAAIVSRELGIPCIVGTERATKKIKTGDVITVDTTGSEGYVFKGAIPFEIKEHDVRQLPKLRTDVMVNIAMPDMAFETSFLPVHGVGLAREEFIIASQIGIHPMALINYKKLKDPKLVKEIDKKTVGYENKTQFYVEKLSYGIAKIGAAFYPRPVIVRFSDFKTNEYKTLLGGEAYEPKEENPMLGWRGASRYYDPKFKAAFGLECKAMKRVREDMGLTNIIPMIPFCRTPEEGKKVIETMVEFGLDRKQDESLKVYVMCEIPSNIILANEFLGVFDGMSIGSNDLTQLVLGLDRDSGIVSHVSNENNEAVKEMIKTIIRKCRDHNKYIGICGQAPSDYPDFAAFLVEEGILSMSLNPDTVIPTILKIAKVAG